MKCIITILLIGLIFSKSCGDFIPSNKNECFQYSNLMEYCCYITDNKGEPGCGKIGVAEYPTFRGAKYYAGNKYDFDCGNTYNKNSSIACGNNPSREDECYSNSTIDNSCCYYNYGGYRGCLYYGQKINGSMPFGLFILKCGAGFVEYSLALILLIFLI
jgi:hypothetical protein